MEKLGVELPLLITQIVNFTIMVVILTKLLYTPILRALEQRRQNIEDGLHAAKRAQEQEEQQKIEREKILAHAREEAKKIREEAAKEGKKLAEAIVAEGKKEVAVWKKKQEEELAAHEEKIIAEVRAKTADVAESMVKKLLPSILSESDHHALIAKQLAHIEKAHGKG